MKIILIFIMLMFMGCAANVQYITEYQDVYIPIPCDVPVPKRPPKHKSTAIMAANILKYTEMLEIRLEQCVRGGNDGKNMD